MAAPYRRYGIALIAAWVLSASAWAQAPQAAGRFISVTGDVTVVGSDGARRAAERGGDIRAGDTIVTGDSALAQARMSDGGLISIRADSEFKLEQFGYKGREDRDASFVVSILKGGFRTITGLISRANRGGYRINTPAATIGVRGTHFEVVHVLPQIASQQVPAGTYNRVFEGITTVQNPGGVLLQVMRDQTAFASLQGGNPVLVAPPAVIFGRPTPVPRASIPQDKDRAHKDAIKGETRTVKMGDRAHKLESPTVRTVPVSPIETTTIQVAPTTTLISPIETTTIKLDPSTTSTILSPTTTTSPTLSPTTTISPTTTTILQSPTTSTILQSPTTTTILQSPTTTISPSTTTTTILQQPTTTTILQSPTTTTTTTTIKQPTTTTISPILTR